MGARQSLVRKQFQDEGERESGGPGSPDSYTIEPIPQGLEHVVYPKYEEAFRMGLAAFSDPMRTNKFKRDLPPILGTPEFQNHPNGGLEPLPDGISRMSDAQHELSSTGDLLGSNLQIAAYGSNGEIENEFMASEENECNSDNECAYDPSHTELRPPAASKQIDITFTNTDVGTSVGLVRSLTCSSYPPQSHEQIISVSAHYGAPDSPTPSTESMRMSRNTIPVGEQLEEIRIQNIYVATRNKKQRDTSDPLVRSLSLSSYLPGRGNVSDKDLIHELQGGLFDADEDLSKEFKFLENHSSDTGEVTVADMHLIVCEPAQEDCKENVTQSLEVSAAADDEIELLGRVYDAIHQWQYGMSHNMEQI